MHLAHIALVKPVGMDEDAKAWLMEQGCQVGMSYYKPIQGIEIFRLVAWGSVEGEANM